MFQVGHLEAPRRPHVERRTAQVHSKEDSCSCGAHIKGVWSAVGVQADRRAIPGAGADLLRYGAPLYLGFPVSTTAQD